MPALLTSSFLSSVLSHFSDSVLGLLLSPSHSRLCISWWILLRTVLFTFYPSTCYLIVLSIGLLYLILLSPAFCSAYYLIPLSSVNLPVLYLYPILGVFL
ncbi:hypothetical protein BGX38DRAFT_1184942 [Terfezia claveryi]|nr:hypothetical protein BGX38DRAFT_1184942 [Terfezia claveryi]